MNGEATDLYSPGFTLVRTQFADQHPELVVKFLKVYDHAVKWQKAHPEEAVTLYARLKNLDKKVVTQVLNNTEPLNKPISKKIINAQQHTADFQYKTKAIQRKIDVNQVVDNSFIEKMLKEEMDE